MCNDIDFQQLKNFVAVILETTIFFIFFLIIHQKTTFFFFLNINFVLMNLFLVSIFIKYFRRIFRLKTRHVYFYFSFVTFCILQCAYLQCSLHIIFALWTPDGSICMKPVKSERDFYPHTHLNKILFFLGCFRSQ